MNKLDVVVAPVGLCQCGCGERTDISKWSRASLGWVKGQPKRFVRGHNSRRPLEERFWEKVEPTGFCWSWTGALSDTGYGSIGADGITKSAHRVAYELLIGPVPEGLHVDHLCRRRLCVNPDHLELVEPGENTRRGLQGRMRTHCVNGHPRTEKNTYVDKKTGWRKCRICHRERARRRREKQSERDDR